MKVNRSALMQLAETRNWSIPELAKRLGINYSYLYRIIRGEKQGGAKLWSGIYVLCKQEGLSIEDYVFMDDR
ncbi:MAG: helix-turn-helix transcriptional regulator [Syntrophomonadaceae bacterium]|jgi:predicted transcriptional regulator|nr:helix-turn-helix transcriptional regulator [Syntrophomonadaceae bacterium]